MAADPPSTISSAPGGRLVYSREIDDRASLFTINPDGTDTKPLMLPVGASPRWSPDGRHILVVADNDQGRVFVGRVDPDGHNYVQFDSPDPTLDLGCFAWSPDASRLACEGWDETDPTRNGMYTVGASDGGDLVRVTTCPNGCHDIPTDYSPDGREIVFARQQLPDEADITLMVANIDGSNARPITDQRVGLGRWSPDGRTVLTDLDGSLLLVPTDGGETRTIKIGSGATLKPFGAGWSPDGTWIAFSARNATSVDLYITQADGTTLQQVTDTPGNWEGGVDWTR